MPSLADIRARLAAQENRSSSANSGDNTVYRHWDIADGSTAVVRFLPDANADNPYFWVERAMIKLPFNGIKNGDSKQVEVQVPCMEMYGPNETCPVLTEVRPWFKDPSLEDMARKYWKKRTYFFQGFVHDDPMNEEDKPENPIRRFNISPQIFKVIQSSLMDPELEELPTDYNRGLDFRINKIKDGTYSNYTTSTWSRKETSLSEDELASIESNGLYDLGSFLPKKPTEAEIAIIKEMFEASVDGEAYDPVRWGQYYKPFGLHIDSKPSEGATPSADAPTATEATTEATSGADEIPFETEDSKSGGSSKAENILAQIRSRQTA